MRAGGWEVTDSPTGSELQRFTAPPSEVKAPPRAVTLLTVVHGWQPDAERWLVSAFTNTKADFEAVMVDNSGDYRIEGWLAKRAAERLRVITLKPPLGFPRSAEPGPYP